MECMLVYFNQNNMNISNIQANEITEKISGQGVSIEGINIKDGNINGINFNNFGTLEMNNIKTQQITSVGMIINSFSGTIEFEDASLSSGTNTGFSSMMLFS